MPQTSQMLADYPEIHLQVIAEIRGAFLDEERSVRSMIDSLGGQISDPTLCPDGLPGDHGTPILTHGRLWISSLGRGGELREAQFSRDYGSIRQMGPSRLEREQPWNTPESVAEILYYYGLIGRTYKGEGQNAHTIIFIPSDILPWLPQPATADGEQGLAAVPVPPPPVARMLQLEDAFLEDTGTLLGFLHTERVTPAGRRHRRTPMTLTNS